MTDLILFAGNTLIGFLFIGLWYSDKKRPHFAYWGAGQSLISLAAMTSLFVQGYEVGLLQYPLGLFTFFSTALGIACMLSGSFSYRAYYTSQWRTIGIAVALIFGTLLMKRMDKDLFIAFTTLVLVSGYASVSWALFRDSVLERLAAALFAARAINLLFIATSGGLVQHSAQTPISHLIALAAASCLLLATFQRKTTELEQRNDLLAFSNKLISALQGKTSEHEVADESLRQIIGTDKSRYGFIHLLDSSGQWFELIASTHHSADVLNVAYQMPVAETLSGIAIQRGKVLPTTDYANEPGAWKALATVFTESGVEGNVSIPLMSDKVALGVMNISYPGKHTFLDQELETLEAAGHVIGTWLAKVRNLRDLAFRSHNDSLTGLGNREALHACFATHTVSHGICAMLLLDLDRFKEVNDTLGHLVGDQLLCEIAHVLSSNVENHRGQAFRLGGDEFAIMLPNLAHEDDGYQISQQLIEQVSQPLRVNGMALRIGASIGLSFAPRHGYDSHELLRCADVAMYRAKSGGTRVEVYDRSRDLHTPERLNLLAIIPESIRNNEFVLYYQPQIDLKTNELIGSEALIRWQHPTRGLLPPSEFLPLAEVSDVMRPLTEWVSDTAIAQGRAWRANGLPARVAINLSARNILDPNLTRHLLAMLSKHELEASDVELELTETALLHDPATSTTVLAGLAAHGFVLALDDFGTGFSSLSYLKQYPFDVLKIDRSFVADMRDDAASLAIVRSTIQLAHDLGMKVVAEGVDNQETLNTLAHLQCDIAQGYFLSRPMPAANLPAWLKERQAVANTG